MRPSALRWRARSFRCLPVHRRLNREGLRVGDGQIAIQPSLSPILEGHLDRGMNAGTTVVECMNEVAIALVDDAAADLPGAGQLPVVGIQFLVQHQEAAHLAAGQLRILGEIAVYLLYVLADYLVKLWQGGQLLIAAVLDGIAFCPVPNSVHIDVDEGGGEGALVAKDHGFLDEGKELQLVLDVLGGKEAAVLQLTYILCPVDDLEVPGRLIEEAGIPRSYKALFSQGLSGVLLVLVVAEELARRLEENLAVVLNPDFHVGHDRPYRLGEDFAVALGGDVEEGFRLPVELFQVEAERAVEGKEVGADGFARRVGHANVGEAKDVLQRPIDQQLSQAIMQPGQERHLLAVQDLFAVLAGDANKVVEELSLQAAGIFHPDHHAGQQIFEDPGWGEIKGGADLPQILLNRCCALRTGHAETCHHALAVVEVVVADPGGWQVGEDLVPVAELVESHCVAQRSDGGAGRQESAL